MATAILSASTDRSSDPARIRSSAISPPAPSVLVERILQIPSDALDEEGGDGDVDDQDRIELGPNGELGHRQWFVVLVDQQGQPKSIAYIAEDQDEANAWCSEWNDRIDQPIAYALPGPVQYDRQRQFDLEVEVSRRLLDLSRQLSSTSHLQKFAPSGQ